MRRLSADSFREMIFITAGKEMKRVKIKWWAVLFWMLVWQAAAMAIGQEILLVSPIAAIRRLFVLAGESVFWQSVGFSLLRIIAGFFGALLCGTLFAGLSARFLLVKQLLAPLMLTIKTIPVASFVILVLIWVSSKNLSVLISFLMVLPIIYTNVLDGIEAADSQLLEMASVFKVPAGRRIRYIYVSEVLPFFKTGALVALGLCWKAGVAAEVIGIPKNSIGEHLYNAKVYLDTPDLFAWTLVIIIISLVFEKIFLALLNFVVKRLERMV